MIKIEDIYVTGFPEAVKGMRNPLNSWHLSDSEFIETGDSEECYILGERDFNLAKSLAKAGRDHAKYRRMIVVYADITAPLYWWKEFDTYKVGTVANSCSTMHTIAKKEFTVDDFSHDQLITSKDDRTWSSMDLLEAICEALNDFRRLYLETGNKTYWWQIIQLLPSSYNQKRTVMMNYEVLANIWKGREGHKLDEWHRFRDWIAGLPYAEGIIFQEERHAESYAETDKEETAGRI